MNIIARRSWLGSLLASALAWAPGALPAQATRRRPLIGYLQATSPDPATQRTQIAPLERGLRALGWTPGEQLDIEYRWAEGRLERLPGLLAELLKLEPALLVAVGPRPVIVARDAGGTLPVVAVHVDDPVNMGVAASYQRPGGRFTGISGAFAGILDKRLQILKDLLPDAPAFAILANPLTNPMDGVVRSLPDWQRQLGGIALHLHRASAPAEFESAFAAMLRQRVAGLAILADATFWTHRAALGALCAKHRLPAVVGGAGFLDSVGVASYQGDIAAMAHRAASLVDRILKGTPPCEIPWEQSTKLELVVSAKAARALGLSVPRSLLVNADQVIE
jgi:putative tryptophan/tyrosine transport system substrate-binding protein